MGKCIIHRIIHFRTKLLYPMIHALRVWRYVISATNDVICSDVIVYFDDVTFKTQKTYHWSENWKKITTFQITKLNFKPYDRAKCKMCSNNDALGGLYFAWGTLKLKNTQSNNIINNYIVSTNELTIYRTKHNANQAMPIIKV